MCSLLGQCYTCLHQYLDSIKLSTVLYCQDILRAEYFGGDAHITSARIIINFMHLVLLANIYY